MRRRDTLRTCGALAAAGGLGLLAGCSGGGEDPDGSASLAVESFDYREGESGDLVVTVTVANAGEADGTGYLYLTVTAAAESAGNESDSGGSENESDGDNTVTVRKSREVSVPADGSKTVEIPVDVRYEQFVEKGSIDPDLRE
ncbi:hypothetical protein BRC82_03890 [Halobacteriales archaeon QS_1_67_19]|nr:MAG: hypothetical protein BRC82_03890 [Halobacteriales archaeon QS_1_67_19]